MGEIAASFGIEWPKLIAQILIFVIVYVILKNKAFGPVLGMLEKRRERIAEGEANLEKIKKDLEHAESNAKEIVSTANGEADRLVDEAKESAAAAGEKKKQEAINEAGKIISKAKDAAEAERQSLLGDMKRDFSRLVVDATAKVSGKVLTKDDQERINKETAAEIKL